jgi:protocatechuate 3,4-dioxygenase beta subunit
VEQNKMEFKRPVLLSRRSFLWRGLTIPAALILAACGGRSISEVLSGFNSDSATPSTDGTPIAQALPPTPACGDDDNDVTVEQTEGPFYTPNTPERTSFLEPGITGTPMMVTGYVLSTDCQTIPGALLDFWHADDAGVYDNVGFRLLGHQFADDQGRFTLETIMPGLYPGRTRHFHVKVQAPNQPVLTTQLYFPDEPSNATDGIFHPALVMDVQDSADGKVGNFNFVLNV